VPAPQQKVAYVDFSAAQRSGRDHVRARPQGRVSVARNLEHDLPRAAARHAGDGNFDREPIRPSADDRRRRGRAVVAGDAAPKTLAAVLAVQCDAERAGLEAPRAR